MKKYLLIILIITYHSYSQEVFFESGMNFTTYNYSDANGSSNDNIEPGTGVYLRAGLGSIGYNSNVSFGISLNQLNANGGNTFDIYDWKVTHLGLFAQWCKFFNRNETLGFNVGLEFSTMISGKQVLGQNNYKLSDYNEFNGLWTSPRFGIGYQIVSTRSVLMEVGYSFLLGLNISGNSDESLSFSTHQIGLKLNLF